MINKFIIVAGSNNTEGFKIIKGKYIDCPAKELMYGRLFEGTIIAIKEPTRYEVGQYWSNVENCAVNMETVKLYDTFKELLADNFAAMLHGKLDENR